jgi:hypothetical protein
MFAPSEIFASAIDATLRPRPDRRTFVPRAGDGTFGPASAVDTR